MKYIIFILFFLFTSCQVQKSELTGKKWILSNQSEGNDKQTRHTAFRKSDKNMVITFNESGLLLLDNKNEKLSGYWGWNEEDYIINTLINEKNTEYTVTKLGSGILKMYEYNVDSNHTLSVTSYTFLTEESNKWRPDSVVNSLNLMN